MSTVSRTGDLRPDIVAYGLVALAHFRAGLTANGLDVLNACARSLQPATAAAYAQCLATAAGTGDAAAATALWRHMAALGVQPDDACHAAFIAAASRSRLPGAVLPDCVRPPCRPAGVPMRCHRAFSCCNMIRTRPHYETQNRHALPGT